MVRDGYFYALGMIVAAAVLWLTTHALWIAVLPLILAAFFLWFFRDPERATPADPNLVISPADGKVTAIAQFEVNGEARTRISIFLNVFNVHVNRSPIAGVIKDVQYQKGKFGNAMGPGSSDVNEQNIVMVEGDGHRVVFKQIAGLLARRIVFTKNVGDQVQRGERIGLIKFASRVDVILEPAAQVKVKLGDNVVGAKTVIAVFEAAR
jgi:phosphatidylserine decarboxylase